jgi:hypothetical protein
MSTQPGSGETQQAGAVFIDRLPDDWDPMYEALVVTPYDTYVPHIESRFSNGVLATINEQIRTIRAQRPSLDTFRRGDEL